MLEKLLKLFTIEELTDFSVGLLKVIILLLLSRLFITISWQLIDKVLIEKKQDNYFFEERKVHTLALLLKSLARYTIYALAFLMILRQLGINTSALLAGAGVLGLAIGFGAQSLVKDIITGFFILFEDQYSIGDYIITPDAAGVVEEFGLRITKLRDANGGLHIIPNSEIRTLTNFNRGNGRAVVDVEVDYYEDTEKVLDLLKNIVAELTQEWPETIVQEPDVLGVTQLSQTSIGFRIIAQTLPMEHWKVERELRRRIKDVFAKEGIEGPRVHQVILNKNEPTNSQGKAGGNHE